MASQGASATTNILLGIIATLLAIPVLACGGCLLLVSDAKRTATTATGRASTERDERPVAQASSKALGEADFRDGKARPGLVLLVEDDRPDNPRVSRVEGYFDVPPDTGANSYAKLLCGDVTIWVAAAPVASLFDKTHRPSKEPGFGVMVLFQCAPTNRGAEYRKWQKLIARDDLGNRYQQLTFGNQPKHAPIISRELTRIDAKDKSPVVDMICFERPDPAATEYLIDLPGSNVGVLGTYKLRVTKRASDAAHADFESDLKK